MNNLVVARWYESKEGKSFGMIVFYIDMLYMGIYLYMFYLLSSPYLLVFGDDRIRDIREQMVLQVDLVRYRVGAGLVLGKFSQSFYIVFMISNQL